MTTKKYTLTITEWFLRSTMVTIRAAPQMPPAESHKTMSNWKQGLLYRKVYMYTVDDGIEVMAAQFVSESSFLLKRFLDKHSGKCMFKTLQCQLKTPINHNSRNDLKLFKTSQWNYQQLVRGSVVVIHPQVKQVFNLFSFRKFFLS